MLTRKNQQPSKTPTPVTPKTPTYKAKEFQYQNMSRLLTNYRTPPLIMLLIKTSISNPQRTNPQNTNHHLN